MSTPKPVVIRSAYDGIYPDVSLDCGKDSMTKQSMKDECDINLIMKRYEKTGLIAHVQQNEGFYADLSHVPDYQSALAIVQSADEMFMSLPSDLRARFENDPAKYLAFCSDPANRKELIQLGMVVQTDADRAADKAAADAPAAAAAAAGGVK